MKVLIVEDEYLIRMDLEYRISRLGFNIIGSSSTGAGAIFLAKQHRPDIIFMDIKLKGDMNGIDAANDIFTFLTCNIIFISAFDEKDLDGKIMKPNGKIGYFSKPINDFTLQSIFKEFC